MLGENEEAEPKGSDLAGRLADLLEGARWRNLSANSLAAYERTWTKFPLGRIFLPRTSCVGLDRIRTSTSSISL